MYVKLAEIYDAAHSFIDYRKSTAYLVGNIRSRASSAQSLLELACGTGRYLELLSAEFEVEGFDLSCEMLAKAKERLPAVPLHHGDMTSFSLDRRYDVVCCLFRSIAYVRTTENLAKAVQSMANHLLPGGLLMIEPFFTPETYWVNRVTLNEYKTDDLKIAWMYVSEKTAEGACLRTHYLVGRPTGVVHFVESHELGLFSRDDFSRAFSAAGLSLEYDPVGPVGVGMYFGRKA